MSETKQQRMVEVHPVHRRLLRCPTCGLWTGIIDRRQLKDDSFSSSPDPLVKILCLCDGPLCRQCGKNRLLRPSSCCYDEGDDSVWHISIMAGMALRCAECKETKSGE